MNDFSKEELKYLHEMIGSISIAGHPIDDEALESKIQSMIDGYCEHSESRMDCDGGISLVCKECGAITMDI